MIFTTESPGFFDSIWLFGGYAVDSAKMVGSRVDSYSPPVAYDVKLKQPEAAPVTIGVGRPGPRQPRRFLAVARS